MVDVLFLVLPGTMLLDFAGTAESLRVAASFGAPFRLHYIGPGDGPRSSLGLTLGGAPVRSLMKPLAVWRPGEPCKAMLLNRVR